MIEFEKFYWHIGISQEELIWSVKFKEKSRARAAFIQKFARTRSHAFYSYKFTLIYILITIYYNCAKNFKNRAGKCANRAKIARAILNSRIARNSLTTQELIPPL